MANQEHLDILKQGVNKWNTWRSEHYGFVADLTKIIDGLTATNFSKAKFLNTNWDWSNLWKCNFSESDLRYAGLIRTNFLEANLDYANLSNATAVGAFFEKATLKEAIFTDANLWKADLTDADLTGANLTGTNLSEANLNRANLTGADLTGANLNRALLTQTDFTNANLTGCLIYGTSTWDVVLEGTIQKDLIITPPEELVLPSRTLYPSPTLYPGKSAITVDNLEVAQFINILLNNSKICDVIDTITSKVVLILGRFTDERKPVLDALRDELRNHNYSPVVFDFEKPTSRNLTETMSTLAHLSRFVLADLTDARSIPQELEKVVPHLPSVPIQPILQEGTTPYAMFKDYEQSPQVMPIHLYQDIPSLLASLKKDIITRVEQRKDWRDEKRMQEEIIRMQREEIRMQKEEIKRLKGGK